jgi:hypothetical protein
VQGQKDIECTAMQSMLLASSTAALAACVHAGSCPASRAPTDDHDLLAREVAQERAHALVLLAAAQLGRQRVVEAAGPGLGDGVAGAQRGHLLPQRLELRVRQEPAAVETDYMPLAAH